MPKPGLILSDGEEIERFYFDADGIMHRSHLSVNEGAIMAENQAIRSAGGARSLDWAKPVLRMSLAQYYSLQKRFPALRSRDNQERTKAWLKIMNDSEFRYLSVEDH
jgi:hypothetical protein